MRRGRNRDEDWQFKSSRDAALAGLAAPHARSGRQQRAEARAAVALLGEVTVLRALPPEVLAELAGAVWDVDYPAGRVLVSQGGRVDNGLVVLRGSVFEHASGVPVAEHAEQSLLNLELTPGVHFAPSTIVAGAGLRAVVVDLVRLGAAVGRHPAIADALANRGVPDAGVVAAAEPPADHRPIRVPEMVPLPRAEPAPGLVARID